MTMSADLVEKTERYERMLSSALDIVKMAPQESSSLSASADECMEMVRAYLSDGQNFHKKGDYVNALAAFSYGYGWLDSGVRFGLFAVPEGTGLFTI